MNGLTDITKITERIMCKLTGKLNKEEMLHTGKQINKSEKTKDLQSMLMAAMSSVEKK